MPSACAATSSSSGRQPCTGITPGPSSSRPVKNRENSPSDRGWNGVPLRAMSDDRSFRDTIGTGQRLLIGTIATLTKQKGLHDLIRVAKRLMDRGHDVQFVVVGEGRLRKELEALRAEKIDNFLFDNPDWVNRDQPATEQPRQGQAR